jgi:signal transduction histidine kinase
MVIECTRFPHRAMDRKSSNGRLIAGSYFRPRATHGRPAYACEVNDTAATDRLDGRTMLAVLGTVVALTVIDLVLGRTLFHTVLPALGADVAVALAVVIARRHLLVATLLAAAASTAVSAAVADATLNRWALVHDIININFLVGRGAWPGIGELVGLAVLCAMTIRHRPAAEASLAAIAYGSALLSIVDWRQQGRHGGVFLLILTALFAATVAAGMYARTAQQRRVAEARAARQSERDAIARELHDLVAHHVTGIVVQAQAARLVADERPDVTASALWSIERAGADALSSMRAMVGALRTDRGDAPIAPAATLDDIRRLATSGGVAVPVVVSLDPGAAGLPSSVIASLHRIAIEAVTNARRHGTGATRVDVAVDCAPSRVRLSVANDGALVRDRQPGFGLVGIAERVAALGGKFEAGPRSAGGWALVAVLPTSRPDTR